MYRALFARFGSTTGNYYYFREYSRSPGTTKKNNKKVVYECDWQLQSHIRMELYLFFFFFHYYNSVNLLYFDLCTLIKSRRKYCLRVDCTCFYRIRCNTLGNSLEDILTAYGYQHGRLLQSRNRRRLWVKKFKLNFCTGISRVIKLIHVVVVALFGKFTVTIPQKLLAPFNGYNIGYALGVGR